jgi:hypothetical protein
LVMQFGNCLGWPVVVILWLRLFVDDLQIV